MTGVGIELSQTLVWTAKNKLQKNKQKSSLLCFKLARKLVVVGGAKKWPTNNFLRMVRFCEKIGRGGP